MNRFRRWKQVARFGWLHAGQISLGSFQGRKRVPLFFDILRCYCRYGMWSNQYKEERFWALEKGQRKSIGDRIKKANQHREKWVEDFYEERDFFIKYGNVKYERASLREKRNKAYSQKYNAGKNLMVEYDVNISRQHYLDGTISIGDNVFLAKHVFIDYSGDVVIHDDVALANGVIIETHTHPIDKKGATAEKGHLTIERGVKVLSGSYIADTCHRIGRHARIGAGSYVRGNVLPYAILMGNPAKIVGFLYTPKEIVEYEKSHYPETERIPLDTLEENYNKYFKNRIKEIKELVKQ